MSIFSLQDFLHSVAMLAMLIPLYLINRFFSGKSRLWILLFTGAFTALIGIVDMHMFLTDSMVVAPDARSILIIITGVILGPVPMGMAGVAMLVYRIIIGGTGLFRGVVLISASMLFGFVCSKRNLRPKHTGLKFFFMGLVGMIFTVLTLWIFIPNELALTTLQIYFLYTLIYPIVSLIIGLLWGHLKDRLDLLDRTLEETKVKFRNIFENEHTIMFLINPADNKILDANIAAQNFYGYDLKTFLAMRLTDLSALNPKSAQENIDFALSGTKNKIESKHRKADGSIADVTEYLNPFRVRSEQEPLLFCIVHDMSDLVHAMNDLKNSESRFRMLVEHAPEAIYIHYDSEFVFLNPMALQLFGAQSEKELLQTSIDDRFPVSYKKELKKEKKMLYEYNQIIPYVENQIVKLDGSLIDTEMSSVPVPYQEYGGAIVFARDVSEKKRLQKLQKEMEAHLLQQQKLESIGTLAGGVAHEINNPINGVMNYAQLILDDAPEGSSLTMYASEIIHETERVANIVQDLLQFSRHEKQTHSMASMYDIINHTVSLIRTIIKKDQIELILDIDENLPNIKCRSQQVQQVLMNLLTNARDALNEKYPDYDENKKIILRCYRTQDDGMDYVTISVKDYGIGISQENLGRIFEPFFSTKPKNKGTGLGMSISFGIISDHKGRINIDTQEGEYTKMTVDFPIDNGWELSEEKG